MKHWEWPPLKCHGSVKYNWLFNIIKLEEKKFILFQFHVRFKILLQNLKKKQISSWHLELVRESSNQSYVHFQSYFFIHRNHKFLSTMLFNLLSYSHLHLLLNKLFTSNVFFLIFQAASVIWGKCLEALHAGLHRNSLVIAIL